MSIYIYIRGVTVHKNHGSVRTSVLGSRFGTFSVQYGDNAKPVVCLAHLLNQKFLIIQTEKQNQFNVLLGNSNKLNKINNQQMYKIKNKIIDKNKERLLECRLQLNLQMSRGLRL